MKHTVSPATLVTVYVAFPLDGWATGADWFSGV
jgi:hypothetical protein